MRVYLAGPMSGWPEHNFPAFNERAAELRAKDIEVFNPAENGPAPEDAAEADKNNRAFFIRKDIFAIVGNGDSSPTVDAVVLLDGWQHSRGARLEVEIALQCDIPVLWADTLAPLTDDELRYARDHYNEHYLLPNYKGVPA